jgi:hypothetical protein
LTNAKSNPSKEVPDIRPIMFMVCCFIFLKIKG